jgi:hypothetical protein
VFHLIKEEVVMEGRDVTLSYLSHEKNIIMDRKVSTRMLLLELEMKRGMNYLEWVLVLVSSGLYNKIPHCSSLKQ